MAMASNYATVAFTATLGGAALFVEQGALRDTVTDAAVIALWPSNFTATVPTAATVGQNQFNYLAAYPRGC
jgi:hypothetical protein